MTPSNPLVSQKKPTDTPTMDLMLGGLPGATAGAEQSALAAMLGPGGNLKQYAQLGGTEYADQLDQMMMNPMNAWF